MIYKMLFDELYPSGLLEKRKKLLRRFWNGRIPTVWSAYPDKFSYRQMEKTDEMAHNACLNLKAGAKLPGINIPRLTMDNHIEDFGSYTDYLRHVEKLRRKDTRIWYILRPDLPDFTDQVSFAEALTDEI